MASSEIPRTVKAVSTAQLIYLDEEARACELNRQHGAGWLAEHADPEATHYLWPALVHRLNHRPEHSPHWRCMLLLTLRDGQEVFSMLDVLPAAFDRLAESLDRETKTRIARRLLGSMQTVAEWSERNA
ncbi:hypothetical protein FHS43_006132 [Streptosporangium becharense]|uniref:Uncharacterized protein n=1 Tax=Streptosporangium becharense TaxID=1816182 RepID=A0A7W9IGJ8_9ACTN|nr:hypothetical protein [Streptosporangium becharense]MBB2914820.1 hypothetical protein [Streptosporangium becharense]MBB5820369.1 hypothetical protein [Streptosporangium becharense]